MSEKVRGERAVQDELARKKRKTAGVGPHKPGGISLGGDQTTQTQSATMSEWSDNDGAPVAPPPSTKAPPCNMHVEVQSKGGEGVPEQQAEERLTVGAARPLAQGTREDPRAVPGCSSRQHQFKTVY